MRLLPLLLLVACARSNERLIEELERRTAARPDAESDAVLDEDRRSVALLGPERTVILSLLDDRVPTVRGRVNGVELPLLLDTGASLVFLSGPAARETALYLPPRATVRTVSPGFDALYRAGVFETLALGDARFGRGSAYVPLREPSRGAHGIVGCSVLGRYRITFDFKSRRVRLKPVLKTAARPFFVDAWINGRRYSLLADSGATRLFLEPWAAQELGLISKREARRHESKSASFRSGRVTRVRLRSVRVAGRLFENVSAAVVNTFGARDRRAGLLGPAAFGELAWTFDFATRSVRIEG